MSTDATPLSFKDLGLAAPVLKALDDVGYEIPTPIQAGCIPHILEGRDLLGQAQTGTGKTAGFALPLLSRISNKEKDPQILVLTPTRELAIQVAEAFQSYARYLKNFHVLPLYGGQSYTIQLRQLKRRPQVIVGTPGRLMDHMRQKTLKLDNLKTLVLDEADEMLRMGFIDDVQWILTQIPQSRQIALFSATMPDMIRKVAHKYLNQPQEIKIADRTTAAKTIRQRYWQVSGLHKLDALTRILETEDFNAMLIFVRTKTATVELSEKLAARGYACEALNGDIQQKLRERTVDRLRKGHLDLLIATDVAARGLDVQRISHVINYDIPYDTESYVHRIGRTGRAGRTGEAILFIAPRERRLLKSIERTTQQSIEPMRMPTVTDINQHRINRFKQRISDTLAAEDLDHFYQMVEQYQRDEEVEPLKIAAALAKLLQGNEPMLIPEKKQNKLVDQSKPAAKYTKEKSFTPAGKPKSLKDFPEIETERFRIEVGLKHEVKPSIIITAIANEAEIQRGYIGHIEIFDTFSTVDLPVGMPKETLKLLKKAIVCGQNLEIKRLRSGERSSIAPRPGKPKNRLSKQRNIGKRKKSVIRSKPA